ncbi:MAG: formyltetrahydrofolate deformylase [Alphaproteobacteria bacterium]|nr:MAG: formyltetrahydrofolate deformylase [Alphaproteobacteria bacterium]
MTQGRYILTLQCPDAVGIVAAVSGFLAERGFSIEESAQFHDLPRDAFYMRTAFSGAGEAGALRSAFAVIASRFGMEWRLYDQTERPRIVVAVSKIGHCFFDLLHREQTGWLGGDIAAVVSNHPDMEAFTRWREKPYFHLPVTPENKAEAEARMLAVLEETGAELLVLARYMQVLSPDTCAKLAGRCINIHHSFLPSFKGAEPYTQAHARGVKIIGATAHYVTPDLDEGPIIEQAVSRVAHHHTPKDLIEIGRDVESQVLSRAVRWHLQRRVVITGNKTVVFA